MTAGETYWQTARKPGLLTAKQLHALELYRIHHMTYREIAAALGIAFETVRDRIRRAESKITHQIETGYFTPDDKEAA